MCATSVKISSMAWFSCEAGCRTQVQCGHLYTESTLVFVGSICRETRRVEGRSLNCLPLRSGSDRKQ